MYIKGETKESNDFDEYKKYRAVSIIILIFTI